MGSDSRPQHPLWGRETEHALANFTVSGRPLAIAIVRALAEIKAEAATFHLATAGPDDGADRATLVAVRDAAQRVAGGAFDEQFLIDIFQTGSGTSTNMNVNEVVASLASQACGLPVHPNDDVNRSQSSNDTFPTAVAMAAVLALQQSLLPAAAQLAASLDAAAERFAGIVTAGRTHMMDAVPILLSDEFGGYAAQIREGAERIESVLARLGRVPLGGTAVGNGLNAPVGFGEAVIAGLSNRLGIPLSVAPNRFAAQAARDSLVEASSQVRGLCLAMMKVANDIRLKASGPTAGLGELRLPELQAGSSIMPGKVNPVMCEMVTQVAVQVFGNDAAVAFAASQGQFELNTFQPVMAANLLDSINLAARACVLFAAQCVDGIEADAEQCRRYAESTPALGTGLNEVLGYDRVAAIVKGAIAQRRTLIDVVVEDGVLDAAQAATLLDADRVARGNRP